MAEKFGIQGRGAFYDTVGALRDVVQNHLMQLVSNIAMEPPPCPDVESIRDERAKVLRSTHRLSRKTWCWGSSRDITMSRGSKPGRRWRPSP